MTKAWLPVYCILDRALKLRCIVVELASPLQQSHHARGADIILKVNWKLRLCSEPPSKDGGWGGWGRRPHRRRTTKHMNSASIVEPMTMAPATMMAMPLVPTPELELTTSSGALIEDPFKPERLVALT